MSATFAPRPYQVEAVQGVRESLARGSKRVMLVLSTGAGKTECGMMIIKSALSKGKRVAFLCNRINLVNQTSRRFFKAGIQHGVIQGSNTSRTYENVIVGSIQTVAKRGLPDVDLIIIDEAHGAAGSKDYRSVMVSMSGKPVIGLTATPFSKGLGKHYDDLGGALFQDMVVAITIQELINQGFLVDCEVYAPSKPDLSNVKIVAGDYNEKELGEAVDKPSLVGDIVKEWKDKAAGTATVCFATNIAHSLHIVEQFNAAGVVAEHIDCYTDEEERSAILARVESGQTMVISNVGILCEGWDFPACRTMILARPTKSLIRYLQMAGRVLRPSPGKDIALILDHSGTVESLGFPSDDFKMVLCDGKPKVSSGSDKKTEEKKPTKCPKCNYLKKTGGKCPICGFSAVKPNTVEHLDGTLSKLERKAPKMKTEDKRKLFSELKSLQKERGWSDGRTAHVFRDIAGTWPNSYKEEKPAPVSQLTRDMVTHLNIKFAKSKGRHA